MNDPDVGSSRFQDQQVDVRTGHSEHIAEGTENYIRPLRNRMRLVDHLKGGDAHRASGAMYELHFIRKETVDAIFDDRVRLTATDLHQDPRFGENATEFFN